MGNLFAEAKLKTALANDTYTDKKEIVSKAGYLLGVDKSIFDSGELLSEIYSPCAGKAHSVRGGMKGALEILRNS